MIADAQLPEPKPPKPMPAATTVSCTEISAPPVHCLRRLTAFLPLESLPPLCRQGGVVRQKILESKVRHQGWLWKEGKQNKKFKRRFFVLYDIADGDGALVYYEEEKTGALAIKGVIALRTVSHLLWAVPLQYAAWDRRCSRASL